MSVTFDDVLYECSQRARRKKKIKKEITDDDLVKIIEDIVMDYQEDIPWFTVDKAILLKHLQKIFATFETFNSSVLSDDYSPWIKYKETETNWKYWNRYKEYLSKKSWSISAIDQINEDTHKILDRLWDPSKNTEDDQWDRRGMVVGNVQSGKTANFTGLICKATDVGYKVIIILAGLHDSLRVQTQKRLDEEFLGYKSDSSEDSKKLIGVSEIFSDSDWVDTITTQAPNGDFNRTVARNFNRHMSDNPILLVVKKNGPVLKNLIRWLTNTADTDAQGNKHHIGYPLLLIDDESDNASVDTSEMYINEDGTPDKEHDPKTINRSIRRILKLFKQSAYVAYTATPQANIYIHEKAETNKEGPDLYPRHFIATLESSSEYFGPEKVFGNEETEGLDLVREVKDNSFWLSDRHNKYTVPGYKGDTDALPPSLIQAIHGFIVATAIRIARGQENKHHSMLIHVTRYTDVQNKIKRQVNIYVKTYLQNVLNNRNSPSYLAVLNEIRNLWDEDYRNVTAKINDPDCSLLSWDEVVNNIYEIVRLIEIKEINGSAKDILEYDQHKDKGLITIVIGGDKLSRGLTLEGLTTSYYLRSTKMYDTLMQMGRWFGYRPGYYDLCRLYTTKVLKDNYRHITLADIEMREQFRYMETIGATPKDYGLKVKSHETLLVTSKVKMRSATTLKISFAASRKESLMFYRNRQTIIDNYMAYKKFLEKISEYKVERKPRERIIYNNVPYDQIINILDLYNTPDDSSFPKNRLLKYIQNQVGTKFLKKWTVYVAQGDTKEHFYELSENEKIPMVKRSISQKADNSNRNNNEIFFPGILVSRSDETVDLEKGSSEYNKALKYTQDLWKKKKGKKSEEAPNKPNDISARFARSSEQGLLIIYPLYPQGTKDSSKEPLLPDDMRDIPMIGYAISFPENSKDEKVEYVVDNKYHDQEFYSE